MVYITHYFVIVLVVVFVKGQDSREELPATPLRAKIRLRENEIRLSVSFRARPNPVSNYQVQWLTWPPETSSQEVLVASPERPLRENVYESRAKIARNSRSLVYAFVLFPSTGMNMGIMFENLSNLTRDLTIPLNVPGTIGIEPRNELVYQPGQDLNFTIIRYSSGDSFVGMDQILSGPHTQNRLIRSILDTRLFVPGQEANFSDRKEQVYTFKSPISRVNGYLQFSTATDHEESAVKIRLFLAKQVPLKPSSQRSTFPDGFISMVRQHDFYDYQAGVQKVYCRRGNTCVINCEAAGDDVSTMTLTVKRTGEEVEGGNLINFQVSDYNVLYKDFPLQDPPLQNPRFLCIARNAQGNVDTQEMLVVYVNA